MFRIPRSNPAEKTTPRAEQFPACILDLHPSADVVLSSLKISTQLTICCFASLLMDMSDRKPSDGVGGSSKERRRRRWGDPLVQVLAASDSQMVKQDEVDSENALGGASFECGFRLRR